MSTKLIIFLFLISLIFTPRIAQARVTPQDIVDQQLSDYQQKVKNYTPAHQQELQLFSDKVAQINKQRTDQLEQIVVIQGTLLDELQRRNNNKETESIKNARYWITYAHEAVAYQAAKIYTINLTSENNMRSDANSLVNLFQADLNSVRSKVINSQNILMKTLK